MISRILVSILIIGSIGSNYVMAANSTDTSIYQGVVKLKNYQYNAAEDSFNTESYGSAVFIGQGKLITNAHVILDNDTKNPTGLYQVCFSKDTKSAPICNTTAILKAYDTVVDLALLEIVNPKGISPIKISIQEDVDLGSTVVMYGYPAIGGNTITPTEGKIAGTSGDMYKIDGTIDHGNSGGGAFDNNRNLVGIPTAVSSDNGVIGYMIPSSVIRTFLDGKTDNYTLFSQKPTTDFIQYAKQIQSIYKNTKSIKDGPISIGDSTKFGFDFVDVTRAKDNNSFIYQYGDKVGHVNLYILCTKDAGYIESWKAKEQGIKVEKEFNKDYTITDEWIGLNKNIYSITYVPVKFDSKKKKTYSKVLYYKNYDECYSYIEADSIDTDKKTIQKAVDFSLNSVSFKKPFVLDTTFKSPFLAVDMIPSSVRLSSYFSSNGNRSMGVSFELEDKRWIHSNLTINKVKKLEDFFHIEAFNSLPKYPGPYTFENFRSRTSQVIKNNATYVSFSKNKKPFIITRYYQWSDNNTALFNIIYPYKLNDKEYVLVDWNFEYKANSDSAFDSIEKFFNSVDLPGTPAFPVNE